MSKKTKIQIIKRTIKIIVASVVLSLIIFLGLFVQTTRTFENANMQKWSNLSSSQQISTVHRIVKHVDDMDLLVACMNKISQLPDSNEMIIRDAISLCYNGIKLNAKSDEE